MRKSYRVKKEADFQRVFDTHNSVANCKFIVYIMENPNIPHFRVGISVGKKIGNAVKRNALKRRIRQAIFELKPQIDPRMDFLVIARPTDSGDSMLEVKKQITHILKVATLLIDE